MSDVYTPANTGGVDDIDDAAEALLKKWEVKEDGSPTRDAQGEEGPEPTEEETPTAEEPEAEEEEVEEDGEDTEEEVEDADDDDDYEEVDLADDNHYVEVKVGNETIQSSVADLKRLVGQEASLTRKSQEVSQLRKAYDEGVMRSKAVLDKLAAAAQEKLKAFEGQDMLQAARTMDEVEFEQYRAAREAAHKEVAFYNQEQDSFLAEVRQAEANALAMQAQQALPIIQEAIPEWNDEYYDGLRKYAIENAGLDADMVNKMVDPAMVLLIDKAMKADGALQKVRKKIRVRKPKKVIKGSKGSRPKPKTKLSKVQTKHIEEGSVESAAEAIYAGWEALAENEG